MIIQRTEMQTKNIQSKDLVLIGFKNRRRQMALLMLAADLIGFGSAISLVLMINQYLKLFVFQFSDYKYLFIPVVCILLFANSRLYPGVGINPAEEIRLVVRFTGVGFLIGLIPHITFQPQWSLNVYAIVIAGIVSTMMVLLARWGVRIQAVQWHLWGEAVAVIGYGKRVEMLTNYFSQRRRLGFVPVLAVMEMNEEQPINLPIPTISIQELLAADNSLTGDIPTVLVDFPAIPDVLKADATSRLSHLFNHITFVSDMTWLEGATLSTHDFEGLLGIEACKNVLNPFDIFKNRMFVVGLSLVIGPLSLPIFILTAVAIRLDSPGPIFFTQERLGKGGRKIKIHKFRTMVTNADDILQAYLQDHPEAARDWEQCQKLRNDPRITRPGKWLRRYSIDELPQLLNVLKGEMSLVGPRPMMVNQSEQYGKIDAYYAVQPGLTGMWQVSGRNHTTFEERARYDLYYVRNWSIWLDIYILARTVWVVLNRDGAY